LSDDKVVPLFRSEDGGVALPLGHPGGQEPDAVLASAAGKLREVVVFGIMFDGSPAIYSSKEMHRALSLAELCKAELVDIMRSDLGWLVPGDDA